MAELTGLKLAVAGAGVFGLSVALRAGAFGAAVDVWDPAMLGDNASGVAGGMIAPVGEALFDDLSDGVFDLLRAGRDGWVGLEALAPGLAIDRCGAAFFAPADAFAARMDRLIAKGAVARSVDTPPRSAHARLAARLDDAHSTEDWRVDPDAALAALKDAVIAAGGVFKSTSLTESDFASFDAVVLAAGFASRRFAPMAPELATLAPIKGQLLRFQGGPSTGPILRSANIYIVPQPGGALAGATMEPGRDDRIIEPETIAALRRRAVERLPALRDLPVRGLAGVRASTPDGLPMAGPSSRPGLYLATGARRNGWLLAPLVSQIVVAYLCGRDPGPFAAALDPRRISHA